MFPWSEIIIIIATMEVKGAEIIPVVSIWPNWGTILAYESVNLTCNVASISQGNVIYTWYRDHHNLHFHEQKLVIGFAEEEDIGNYQCQAGTSNFSEPVRIEVSGAAVILQAPPIVFEGDLLSLRCHSYDKYPIMDTTFYKDQKEILGKASELLIGKVNLEASGLYKCSRKVKAHSIYHEYSGQQNISVQALFSVPQIKVSRVVLEEGDHMILTCDTKLSPHRATTELQFGFNRNGVNLQGFSSSNQYRVPSAQMKDSGYYTCEVQTATGSVRKLSQVLHIHIEKGNHAFWAAILSVIVLLLVIGFGFAFHYRDKLIQSTACCQRQKSGGKSSVVLVRLAPEGAGGTDEGTLYDLKECSPYDKFPIGGNSTEDLSSTHIDTDCLTKGC